MDASFLFFPGYVQHLKFDPFAVHLYTESGIGIIREHLRNKSESGSLYLDATGGVAARLP